MIVIGVPSCSSVRAEPYSSAIGRTVTNRSSIRVGKNDGLQLQLDLAGLDLGEVQHVIDQLEQMFGRTVGALDATQPAFR